MLDEEIASGRAMAKFREMVAAQGGKLDRLSPIGERRDITSHRDGYVAAIDTEQLGLAIIEVGGGRKVMSSSSTCRPCCCIFLSLPPP